MAVPVIPRLLKVATPDDAVAVVVPTSVPPEEMVAVICVELSLARTFPPESLMVTCG